ncbi:SAM-dependent methyltransferase [Catenuloplanes atrovinosus]|uniref:O-methyltransferase involved in polyketide biosynthesis n=1 Tax=Catenuloplanes atrovinosus TaxID=137266 RepID=A0AAE3YP72_9ACTN|nr:SAM-dependent methyltransferase [Catenuloplanes atrovinosus]MDR7276107.1 O-methyltransferase involved in polyketide biosynthesis [Catenuloplanes atrovinosus]
MGKPTVAGMYDYYLGGVHHTAGDREAGDRMLRAMPTLREVTRANRAFLRRAVRYLTAAGIRQFVDIGSGIPTVGNVHEVARAEAPDSRVLYVDVDPEVVALSASLLRGDDRAVAIEADLADPAAILGHPECARLIDPARPTALLMLCLLQWLPDEVVVPSVRTLREAFPGGSFIALSHPVAPPVNDPTAAVGEVYRATGARAATARTRDELVALFGDYVPVEPGLTWVTHWRPDGDPGVPDPVGMPLVVGVARRPER